MLQMQDPGPVRDHALGLVPNLDLDPELYPNPNLEVVPRKNLDRPAARRVHWHVHDPDPDLMDRQVFPDLDPEVGPEVDRGHVVDHRVSRLISSREVLWLSSWRPLRRLKRNPKPVKSR